MEIKLKAESRAGTGKGPARRMREAGEIPAVLYGTGIEARPIKVKREDLNEVLHGHAGSRALIDLVVVDGKAKENHLVMIKEIQRHPFKERLLHVDFMKVAREEKVKTKAAVAVLGEEESVGLKAGGTLQHNLFEVDVECLPADMPDRMFADISGLEIGEHLTVADLIPQPGVTVLTDPEDMIIAVLAPRLAEVEEAVPAAEEEAAPEEAKPEEGAAPGGGAET
jgi:large subunit ribosomal protein L25